DEPARLLDLRLHLRLQDRAVRSRNRDRILPKSCAGQSEHNRNHTPAPKLDFGSEANHAVSNHQTVFADVRTVKQNQPPLPSPATSPVFCFSPPTCLPRRAKTFGGTRSVGSAFGSIE